MRFMSEQKPEVCQALTVVNNKRIQGKGSGSRGYLYTELEYL